MTITYHALRANGWRLINSDGCAVPHMAIELSSCDATFLEVSPSSDHCKWMVWLRCDMSSRRGRFVYVRDVATLDELAALYHAITDRPFVETEYDVAEFGDSLDRLKVEEVKRYQEYCHNHRHGRR